MNQNEQSTPPRKWRNRIVAHGEEDPTQLLANPKNWRIHPKAQQDALAGVLAEVGWVQDVIINQRTGFVVDGHARVAMAISAGERVPVVYVDLSEEEEAVILATFDPISAMAAKDEEIFEELVRGMDESFRALVAATEAEQSRPGPQAGEDDVPETPINPVSRPGDLWLMGKHRLLCGDSTDPIAVARLLSGRQPGLMVTDPPYGISLDTEWRDRAGLNGCGPAELIYMKRRTKGHTETTISGDTIADWSHAFELVPSLQVAYVWHASAFTTEVLKGLLRIGFLYPQQIIWKKNQAALTRTLYWFQHEPCWFCRKKNAPWYGKPGAQNTTIWEAASPKMIMGGSDEEKFDHPTQKPVELMRKPMLNHTNVGELVYEPFGGSGTTLAAAEVTDRTCICMELDPKYVDLIVQRWQNLTGQQATLEGHGATFEHVKEGRLLEAEDNLKEQILEAEEQADGSSH